MVFRRRRRSRRPARRLAYRRSRVQRRPRFRGNRRRRVQGMVDYQRTATLRGRGFPASLNMRFPLTYNYALTIEENSLTGISTAQLGFYLNSLFDPVIGPSTSLPFWYNQVTACGYRRYVVTGVKVRIRATTAGNPLRLAILTSSYAQPATAPFTAANQINAADGVRNDLKVYDLGNQNASSAIRTIVFYLDMARMAGISRRQLLSEDDWAGTMRAGFSGQSPPKLNKMWITACNPPFYPTVAATAARSVGLQINFKYYARLANHTLGEVADSAHLDPVEPLNPVFSDGQPNVPPE